MRVRGLDTIRGVCAIWVVVSHLGSPPILSLSETGSTIGKLVHALSNNCWNGAAAVIIFFVISGFCIHYPYAKSLHIPSLAEFLARRYLRIGLPLLAVLAILPWTGVDLAYLYNTILWSLIAELIYYSLYPVLLAIRRKRHSWILVWVATFFTAIAVAATNPTIKNYWGYGPALTWLLGLPCWIAGCHLADLTAQAKLPKTSSITAWRFALWAVSIACSMLRFHSPVGYPWTLNLFSLMATYWLALEIDHFQAIAPPTKLEWLGRWSYSIYISHVIVHSWWDALVHVPSDTLVNWSCQMMAILTCSYLFFLIVEYPSHLIARSLGKLVSSGRTKIAIESNFQSSCSPSVKG